MKKGTILLAGFLLLALINSNAQNYQINSPDDDAEESAGYTIVTLNSPVIDLTSDPTNPKNMKQIVGLRFNNIDVARGTALSNCYLTFQVDRPSNKISMLAISGEKSANANAFQAVNRNLSSRVKTNAKVNWNNVEAWNETGAIMKSPDISNVLMEIINQNEWRAGNSIVLLIDGNGMRHATAYDKNPDMAIQLILNDASGTRFKSQAIVRAPAPPQPKPDITPPSPPLQTDECNIPEPPVGVAKQAYMQGNAYMENEDFKSAESRFTMALDNLKHPKFYIARAAARQLLSRTAEAQNDINQAIAMGIDARMAQKCFQDIVQANQNFSKVEATFETCFSRNVRNLKVPPCPIILSVGDGKATLLMDTEYENTDQVNGEYSGKPYNAINYKTNWLLDPGEFHECNPNIDTSIKPKNVEMTLSAKTAGWFEIPTKMSITQTFLNGKEVVASRILESNDWYLVGYLLKLHTGQTTVDGGFYKAKGGSTPLRIGQTE